MSAATSPIDQIAERVEQLLVRYDETRHANALLRARVDALTRERDLLKSRLAAARTRIDAVLAQLPPAPADAADAGTSDAPNANTTP